MALTINVDGVTGIDESFGDQVVAGQKHDIATLPAAVTTVFNTALTSYSLTVADAIQLAGDPNDGTGGNDVQVSGDMITGLSLTDEEGDLYDGTYQTGLFTLAGNEVLLLSASNDNVVLGIEAVTGDVVFAIYLQEASSSGNIIGGDFWVALFEPLKHLDPNDPDDVLDLTNKLYVSAEQVINFSFAGAPSGQNEFMAFKSGTVTIVASGEANGNTVNSGQGANLPGSTDKTALGTDSQAINKQQTLNFNFTTGFNPEFIVPGLTPTEASSQANIQFTDVFGTTGAAFNAVKVTGGGPTTKPLIHLSAWNTENLSSGNLETGTAFISGHADDVMVAIKKVFVNGVDVTNNAAMVTNNGNGTFTVIGATENARIKVQTDDTFNRLAIKNGGNDNVAFSVQAFSLESVADLQAEAGSKIDFYDDGPDIGAQKVLLTVWEDALAGGNPDNDGETEVVVALDNLNGLLNPGRDAPGLGFGAIASKNGTTINSDGDLLTFDVSVNKDADITKDGVLYNDEIILSIGTTDHLQILVKSDGSIRMELLNAVDHSGVLDGNPDEDILGTNLGELFEAFDEDGDRQTFGADAVRGLIEDDAPIFDIELGAGELQTDDGALTGGNAGGTDTDSEGVGSLFTVVSSSAGADGDGGVVWELELSAASVATNLQDTATGNFVFLFNESGDIVGRHGTDAADAATGDIVFSLAVNTGTGAVGMTQNRAVMHGTAETEAAYNDDTTGLGLGAGDYINLRGTLSDGEATPDTATDAINIAPNISFTDDGPVFDIELGAGELQTDDGALTGGNAGGTDTDSEGVGSLFTVESSSAGADGDGGTVYTLELGGTTTTTLVDTGTGHTVQLVKNGDDVEGRTVGSNQLVFTLSVASGTGLVTLTQARAVKQATADTSAPYDGDVIGLGVTDAVYLRGTLSDGETEADSATDAIDISANISFTDDGPEITVNDSSGNYDDGAQGTWTDSPGADGFNSLGVKFVSYEINANGTVTVDAALNDGGDIDPYTFGGSVTDDFNGDGTNEKVEFTLVFNPDDGSYDLQVTTPPSTVVTFDTAGGSLDAGGPDPVRTLTVDSTQIVFSAVKPTTDPNVIESFLDTGEAFIEGNATHLDSAQLNVSTSGIANGNNVLEGNAVGGVPDGLTTQGGKRDESFVVDPNIDVSSVKVFIDNSVGGYSRPSEELYYRTYFTDGTESNWILVDGTTVPLTNEAGGQKSFLIGDPNGPNNIDAIQLGMGKGTIKIPVIAFTTAQEFTPESLTLNFQATETDQDSDSATDGFTVDLDPVVA